MRAALITITGQPRDGGGAALTIAGKSVAERQLEFALAAGCERIIAIGTGSLPDAIALRHEAENAGAHFLVVGNSHGLLGTVRAADELMVLVPGLLPDEHTALPALERAAVILVLPAASGVAAGFERIDLERAWAGVAVVPGGLIERLAELPADAEATSALLRLALQARVVEARLSENVIADGSWMILGDDGDAEAIGQAWLDRRLKPDAAQGFSRWLAGKALRPFAGWLLERRRSFAALAGSAILLLAGSVAAAWFEYASIGFALLIAGALVIELALCLAPLLDDRFRPPQRKAALLLPGAIDLAFYACAVLAIDGAWLHRFFPPTVLLVSLYLRPSGTLPRVVQTLEERVVLAGMFAFAALLGLAEPAIMAAALVIVFLKSGVIGRGERLTQA